MSIIDFHTHSFPDAIAPRAIAALERQAGIWAAGDGTAAGLTQNLLAAGADYGLIAPVATRPGQDDAINRKIPGFREGPLLHLGALHPRSEAPGKVIAGIKAAGLPGVKLHPGYQRFSLEETDLYPVYSALEEAGLFVLFHAGGDPGFLPPHGSRPEQLADLAKRHPGLIIIAAHMGGMFMEEEALSAYKGLPNLYIDTANCVGMFPPLRFREMINTVGADHILLGSDWPWETTGRSIRWLDYMELNNTEKQQILGGNAARLLGLESKPC